MQLDPQSMSVREMYRAMVQLVTPRPIAWVSTVSRDGVPNLAPYSYFNAVGSNPPSLMFCPANLPDGRRKDTLLNVEETGEFVVNIVPYAMAEAMNQTSAPLDYETSEFEACGLEGIASERVKPMRVAGAPAAFECQLMQSLHLGTGPGGANMVIGRILMIHVDDDCVDDNGRVIHSRLDPIGRLGGLSYCRTTDTFEIDRPAS